MKVTDKQYTDSMDGVSQSKKTKHKGKTSNVSSSDSTSPAGESSSAKVKLSERAQDMKKIREVVANTPDVDEAKVAKFKTMIANGQYNVDASKVADKMVDEHAYGELFRPDTEG